jgi:hypothetical protein
MNEPGFWGEDAVFLRPWWMCHMQNLPNPRVGRFCTSPDRAGAFDATQELTVSCEHLWNEANGTVTRPTAHLLHKAQRRNATMACSPLKPMKQSHSSRGLHKVGIHATHHDCMNSPRGQTDETKPFFMVSSQSSVGRGVGGSFDNWPEGGAGWWPGSGVRQAGSGRWSNKVRLRWRTIGSSCQAFGRRLRGSLMTGRGGAIVRSCLPPVSLAIPGDRSIEGGRASLHVQRLAHRDVSFIFPAGKRRA